MATKGVSSFFSLETTIVGAFAFALVLLIGISVASLHSINELREDTASTEHTYLIETLIAETLSVATDAETGMRGYALTGDDVFLVPYHRAVMRINPLLRELLERTADNPAQQQRLHALGSLLEARLAEAGKVIDMRRTQGFAVAQRAIASGVGKQLQDQIRAVIEETHVEEQRLLQLRHAESNESLRDTEQVIVAGGLLALLITGSALVSVRHGFAARRQASKLLMQANRDLRSAAEQAKSANRLKSTFLATMSHELRTPLNSIIGFTGIILQGLAGPLNAEQAKQLGMVQNSARHLLALINDVLDLSKIEAGELRVDCAPFDLRAAIARVVGIVTPLAENKGLALRTEVAPAVGMATSDARRVEQVLINLLGNAIKFTAQGEIILSVALDGDSLRLRITDTGIGIKPEDMDTLFLPFRQIDDSLARNHEGTGLGLTICRRLAELMGGAISAESTWGKGSTFSFTLPLHGPGIR